MRPARNKGSSGDVSATSFRSVAARRHYKLQRPSRAQKERKRVTLVSLDVKYRSAKSSDTWHWLEFKNARGGAGWLYEEADFIVFERKADFIIVNRKNLVDWVNTHSKIRHDLPFVANSWQAKYRLYARPRKREVITQIKADDLLQIKATHIWKK